MLHHVVRTVRYRLLFRTHEEGLDVWRVVLRVAPFPIALCLMPDHLHLIVERDVRAALGHALGGLARRRNHQEGRAGPLFAPVPEPQPLADDQKLRTVVRYTHLNPTRARLAPDPLAWPYSTHRDAVGLTVNRVGPRRPADAFHAYVSGDPTVALQGTPLPVGGGPRSIDEVLAGVSAVTRVPLHRLGRDPMARAVAKASLHRLAPLPERALAQLLGISRTTLRASPDVPTDIVRLVDRVAGDPRFPGLDASWLPNGLSWARYRSM